MDKPRIFLGSSAKQAKLLQALTRGLDDIAHVEPWTVSFNPGTTTVERLLELVHEEKKEPAGVFYYWKGERPRHPNAPALDGTGEIKIESVDRAEGYWTTRSDADPTVCARTSGIYLRAGPEDMGIVDGGDERKRAELIAERLTRWKSICNA